MHFSVLLGDIYVFLPAVAFNEIFPLILAVGLRVDFVLVALADFLHVEVAHVHIAVEGEPRIGHRLGVGLSI